MLKKIKFIIAIALAGISLFSCAQEKDETSESVQRRILDAYLQTYYPSATKTSSGLVVLSKQDGKGEVPQNYQVAYISYNTKDLAGNYQSTTNKDVAETLGVYSPSRYYGPAFMEIGYGSIIEGLHEALCMMNKGSKMTVIIPPWLSKYDYQYESGSNSETQSVSVIYEITMEHVITNIKNFQIDSLEAFRDIYYPGLDSVAEGYYFKKLSGTVTDTIEADKSANVWYVGRLLDGYIFDTNIEDTAKKYGIYNSSSTYSALDVTYKTTYQEMSSEGSQSEDSYVSGFARALKSMTYGNRAVTFFWSGLGYGSTSTLSSGVGVPEYSMLYFDIYVEEDSD